jgi:hypothetical protein
VKLSPFCKPGIGAFLPTFYGIQPASTTSKTVAGDQFAVWRDLAENNSFRSHRTWFATVYILCETLNGMPRPVSGKNDLLTIRRPVSSVPVLLNVALVDLLGRACSGR